MGGGWGGSLTPGVSRAWGRLQAAALGGGLLGWASGSGGCPGGARGARSRPTVGAGRWWPPPSPLGLGGGPADPPGEACGEPRGCCHHRGGCSRYRGAAGSQHGESVGLAVPGAGLSPGVCIGALGMFVEPSNFPSGARSGGAAPCCPPQLLPVEPLS